MLIYPLGSASPVAPVARVAKVTPRKAKAAGRATDAPHVATHEARPAETLSSYATQTALDDIKLGG